MIEVITTCPHADLLETNLATEVLADIAGFFGTERGSRPVVMVVHGRLQETSQRYLSVSMPCWRCESTESILEEKVRTWLMNWCLETQREVIGETPRSSNGRVLDLGFDLISIIAVSLGLIRHPAAKDLHGRDDENLDVLLRSDLPRRPYLSYLVDSLLGGIDILLKQNSSVALSKPTWPTGVKWVLGLSHDVDHLNKWGARNLPLRVRDLRRAARNYDHVLDALKSLVATVVGPYLGRRDPFCNVGDLAALEHQRRVAATYFFGIADPGYSPFEISYDSTTLKSSVPLQQLTRLGHEVGLHGSYASADNWSSLEDETKQLRDLSKSPVVGMRQHYLRFNRTAVSHSLRAGLLYDSSWGYWSRPGFRGGFGCPFHVGSDGATPSKRIIEVPMTLMDTSLREFLHLDSKGAAEVGRAILEEASQASGLAVINWHNNAFDRDDRKSLEHVFLELLDAALEKRGTIWTLEAIARWWRYRDSVEASVDEHRLRISHPHGPRAISLRVLGDSSLLHLDEDEGVRLTEDPQGREQVEVVPTES